jgi:hypothetical protein
MSASGNFGSLTVDQLFTIHLNLEPFALDLWREEISSWLPGSCEANAHKRLFFGGLYQTVVSDANW